MLFEGQESLLDELQKGLESLTTLKRTAVLGWRGRDDKHVTIWNRWIELQEIEQQRVVTLEPDPKHMDLLRDSCALSVRPRAVTTPGDENNDHHDGTLLSVSEATSLRSAPMRPAFTAADIPVFSFVANRLARCLAKPTIGAWTHLNRCVRYKHGHDRWINILYSRRDTSYRRLHRRNSASCVMTMIGTHRLRVKVAAQTAPALAPRGAEVVLQVRGSVSCIEHAIQWSETMGREVSLQLYTGSTANLGIASRVGLSKIRHLDAELLWIQHHESGTNNTNLKDLRTKQRKRQLRRRSS